MHAAELPVACENCRAALRGAYCHACGQHAANPLRSLHHAIEDVFESFWHLDGRVFRTLRDLLAPGRVACNYLAGQRVRYLPPLRLFVILSLLTFFVGQLALDESALEVGAPAAPPSAAIEAARTPAEVDAALERELAELRAAFDEAGDTPVVVALAAALGAREAQLQVLANERRRALQPPAGADAAPPAATAPEPEEHVVAVRGDGFQDVIGLVPGTRLRDPARPWHETDNPADVSWLPEVGDRAINHRFANAQRNIEGGRLAEPGAGVRLSRAALAAVPSALFVLVPVFALLLRVLYLGAGRGYLEHLVVALYSHAFLLLVLLAFFALSLVQPSAGPAWTGPVQLALGLAVPVYLLLMQKRVYRQGWPLTLAKYALLGVIYLGMVIAMVVYAAFAGLTSGG